MALIDLKRLRLDGGTQHRTKVNPALIADYAEAYLEGKKLPPVQVIFDGTHHWVWDGFHRIAGAIEAGQKSINVDIARGSIEDAFDLSLGANEEHGLRRSIEDKRAAVKAAMQNERHADKSARDIAKLCHVSHTFVSGLYPGKDVVVKVAKPGNVATPEAAEAGNVATETAADEGEEPGNVATPTEKAEQEPGDVKVTKPKPAVVGSLATISAERDEYKAKLIDMGAALEETMAELKVFETGATLGDIEQALRDENAALRKRIGELEERMNGLMAEKAAAVKQATSWKTKATGKR